MGCKVQELEEQLDKVMAQKEALLKENTRVKMESKTAKRGQSGGGYLPSQ